MARRRRGRRRSLRGWRWPTVRLSAAACVMNGLCSLLSAIYPLQPIHPRPRGADNLVRVILSLGMHPAIWLVAESCFRRASVELPSSSSAFHVLETAQSQTPTESPPGRVFAHQDASRAIACCSGGVHFPERRPMGGIQSILGAGEALCDTSERRGTARLSWL